jgi:hypothetical protein
MSLDKTSARIAEAPSESVVHDRELAGRPPEAVKGEQTEGPIVLRETLAELADSRSQLEECRDDIAKLSDMLAAAQDQVADLERQNGWLREAGLLLLSRGKWWWRFMPRGWQRKKRDERLRSRGLFDSEVYENRYPDVASTGQDSFRHYLYHGVTENRRYD